MGGAIRFHRGMPVPQRGRVPELKRADGERKPMYTMGLNPA